MHRRRHRWLTVLFTTVLIACGCTPSRDLPPEPPLHDVQVLDLCALAPRSQLEAEAPGLAAGIKRRIRWGPGECYFFLVPGLEVDIAIGPAQANLPAMISLPADDDVEVPGGLILKTRGSPDCGDVLISERGYLLEVYFTFRGAPRGSDPCAIPNLYLRTVLRDLADGAPTIPWPDDALALRNLCAELDRQGMGTKVKPLRADARDCDVIFDSGDPFSALTVQLTSRSQLGAEVTRAVTVAGYAAQLETSTECRLLVPVRSNPELRRRAGPEATESLLVNGRPQPGRSCAELLPIVEPFVGRFAR